MKKTYLFTRLIWGRRVPILVTAASRGDALAKSREIVRTLHKTTI